MTEILIIETNLKKIISNYKKIYNFIFLYKDELINILEDQITINSINENINNIEIDNYIKKLDKIVITIENINLNNYIDLYNYLYILKIILTDNITYINQIDIFDKKYLISDTSKNNINQNKSLIIDLYKKYNIDNNNLLQESIINIFNNLDIKNKYNEIFIIIKNKLDSNNNIIPLYLDFLNILQTINITNNFLDVIDFYNNTLKDNILNDSLHKNKIKYNKNINNLFNNNKLYNNNYYTINKIHLFNNYSNFILTKKYKLLSDLIKEELNITKFQTIKYSDHTKLSNIIDLYYKIDKIPLIIILIKNKIDLINYNLTSLLKNNDNIDPKSGINTKFIEKTKTIMTNNEYIHDIKNLNNYINNIENITVYHNKLLYNKSTDIYNIVDKMNSQVLLINYDNHYYNIFSNDKTNIIKLKDVYNIITNKPDYNIENYNDIINNKIITQINDFNILNKYTETVNNTYNLYSNINHTELKNIFINNIKKIKLPFDKNNKNKIIDEILNIISSNTYKYIVNKTNIQLNSELLIVYFSNINSVINKIKKELVDNYSDKLLINIDKIISDQYNNIKLIIDNILDKYYSLNI